MGWYRGDPFSSAPLDHKSSTECLKPLRTFPSQSAVLPYGVSDDLSLLMLRLCNHLSTSDENSYSLPQTPCDIISLLLSHYTAFVCANVNVYNFDHTHMMLISLRTLCKLLYNKTKRKNSDGNSLSPTSLLHSRFS